MRGRDERDEQATGQRRDAASKTIPAWSAQEARLSRHCGWRHFVGVARRTHRRHPWPCVSEFVLAALVATVATAALAAHAQDAVIHHIDNSAARALEGLHNIRNHLDVNPAAKITVVTHAEGVESPMKGDWDRNGDDSAGPVAALAARGVEFEICQICEITSRIDNLKKKQFIQEASFTPSGVVRVARLQHAGAAYIES